jgi:hypothetical protein
MEIMFEDDSIAQWRRKLDQYFGFSTTHRGLLSHSWSQMLMCFPDTHQLSDWGKYVNLFFFQIETKL